MVLYPERDALVCQMWSDGKVVEEIKVAISNMAGGNIGIAGIRRLAGKRKAKRPAWFLANLGRDGGRIAKISPAWTEDEDRLLPLLHEAGLSVPKIVKALADAGFRRGRDAVRRRLITLGLIEEESIVDAEPVPVVVVKPAPTRVMRPYKAPKPISPEPWAGMRKVSRATGFSMLSGRL